jgi:RAQPRD family integrative conjugative element protein
MTIFSRLIAGGLLLALCFTGSVYADTELENAALARVITVLNSLTPLINEAERQQDKNARIQFQYKQLRNDINQIKSGIAEKLQTQTIEPRTIKSIDGDYLVQRSKHT